jgi:hypothetical protein
MRLFRLTALPLALALAALAALAACSNLPTSASAGERQGLITLPEGRVALVLEFTPGDAIDRIAIGPAPGSEGAYFVGPIQDGRVLVYSAAGFPKDLPFRAWTSAHVPAGEPVSARIQSTSTAAGSSDRGAATSVTIR